MPHPWSALRGCLSPHHGGCCCLMAGILSFEASQGGSRCLESLQVKMHLAQQGQCAAAPGSAERLSGAVCLQQGGQRGVAKGDKSRRICLKPAEQTESIDPFTS